MQLPSLILLAFYTKIIFLFINDTVCTKPTEKVYGIRPDQLEQHYVELLFNDKLNSSERHLLARRLCAVHFDLSIVEKISLFTESVRNCSKAKTKKSRKSQKDSDRESLINSYKVPKEKIEKENADNLMTLQSLCILWQLELWLLFGLNPDKNDSFLLSKNCAEANELEIIENDVQKMPDWLHQFVLHMSRKHCEFFMKHFGQMEFWQWFDYSQPMVDESMLSFRLRSLNVSDRLDNLSEVKRIMAQHLFPHQQLASYELLFPIHMAIDVGNVTTSKKLFKGMFGQYDNSPINAFIRWFDVAILYGQIWPYFEQHWNNVGQRPFLEGIRKTFFGFLHKLPEYVIDILPDHDREDKAHRPDILLDLLKKLQIHFGQLSEAAQLRPQKLLGNYERWFVELFEQDQEFRKECGSMKGATILRWLNGLINFGKATMGGEQQPAERGKNTFLKILSTISGDLAADDKNIQKNKDEKGVWEKEIDENALMPILANLSNEMATYDQCPAQQRGTNEQLSNMDTEETLKDPAAFELALSYKSLLLSVERPDSLKENGQFVGTFNALELSAAIWYYNEHMRKLFEFGETLKEKNEPFAKLFNEHKERWKMIQSMNLGKAEQLCWLHKLAYALAFGQMKHENGEWERHMNMLVTLFRSPLISETLIVLSPDDVLNGETSCNNAETVVKFVQKFRTTNDWMEIIHFFCLWRLTKRFKQVQLLFCHGTDTLCTHLTCEENVMDRLMWIVGTYVVDNLKMVLPEIMHYEAMNAPAFCIYLIKMFSCKTNSTIAQGYEARIITPKLLETLNEFEQRLKKGKCKFVAMPSNVCAEFLQTIVAGKNQIFTQFKIGNATNLRLALCQLVHLNNFLAENEAKSTGGAHHKMLSKWDSSASACNSEEGILAAFLAARTKVPLFELIKTHLSSSDNAQSMIRETPGAYARLKNYLINILYVPRLEVFEYVIQLNLRNPAVFTNDQLLFTNYMDAVFSDHFSMIIPATIRTNLTVFVRWMDAKIGDAIKQNDITILAKRFSNVWELEARRFFENFYGQTYDFNVDNEDELHLKNTEAFSALEMTKDFMEKLFKSKKKKSFSEMLNDWKKGNEEAMSLNKHFAFSENNNCVEIQASQSANLFHFIEWLQEIRQNEFIKLITDNDQFSAELKKAIEASSVERAELISEFIDNKQKEDALFEFLGLHELLVNRRKEENSATEEEKTVKKRKAKKKKGKGVNSNAIQMPNLEEKADEKLVDNKMALQIDEKEESVDSYTTALSEQDEDRGVDDEKKNEDVSKKLEKNSENFDEFYGKTKEWQKEEKLPSKMMKIEDFANEGFLTTIYITFILVLIQKDGKNDEKLMTNSLKKDEKWMTNSLKSDDKWMTNSIKSDDKWTTNEEKLTDYYDNAEQLGKLLNVAALSNEIAQRLKVVRELGNDFEIIEKTEKKKIEQIWHKIKKQQISMDTNLEEIGKKLHNLLEKIVNGMEGQRSANNETQNEMAKLLHFHKFARAIVRCDGIIWTQMTREQREKTLLALFEGEEAHEGITFDEFVEQIRQMEFQKKIDKNLYAQLKTSCLNGKVEEEHFKFPHYISDGWQQLKYDEGKELKRLELITEILNSDATNAINEISDELLEKAVKELKQIFRNWNSDAIFEISFRHLLSFQNDRIESICVLPNGFELIDMLGQEICNTERRELCKSNSIYCHFCRNLNVTFVHKNWADLMTAVPLIKMTFFGIPIEIRIVIVPIISRLPSGPINGQKIRTFLRIMAQKLDVLIRADHIYDEGVYNSAQYWHDDEIKKFNYKLFKNAGNDQSKANEQINMLKAQSYMLFREKEKVTTERQTIKALDGKLHVLADFGTYQKLMELLLKDDKMPEFEFGRTNSAFGKFRMVSAYLHKWARENFIYNDELGYFDAKTLMIMLTKIFLLYPNASVSFLVEKFFLTFSTWHWLVPVQLAETDHGWKSGVYLCWTPGQEWIQKRQQNLCVTKGQIPMPIITPIFPFKNVGKNITVSSAKVLKNELRKAFENVRKDVNGFVLPLEKKKFVEKYDHFIIVRCDADEHDIDIFSNFVGKNLQYELLDLVERPLADWVKLCHLLPRWVTVANCTGQKSKDQKTNICQRIWLIGIELNTPVKELSKFKNKLKKILKEKLGEKLKIKFHIKNGIDLQADYLDERQKLAQWIANAEDL